MLSSLGTAAKGRVAESGGRACAWSQSGLERTDTCHMRMTYSSGLVLRGAAIKKNHGVDGFIRGCTS